jgi:hypothetical protein
MRRFITKSLSRLSRRLVFRRAVGHCPNEIGLGYRQTTWNGLVSAAIQSAGHKIQINPTATVLCHPGVAMSSFVIKDTRAVLVHRSTTASMPLTAPSCKPTSAGSSSTGASSSISAKPPPTSPSFADRFMQTHFLQQIQGGQQIEFIENEIERGNHAGQPRVPFSQRT